MSEGYAILFFLAGLVTGAVAGAWWAWERFIRKDGIGITLNITPEVIDRIDAARVSAWLDRRGYMWMPKGLPDIMARAKNQQQQGNGE